MSEGSHRWEQRRRPAQPQTRPCPCCCVVLAESLNLSVPHPSPEEKRRDSGDDSRLLFNHRVSFLGLS